MMTRIPVALAAAALAAFLMPVAQAQQPQRFPCAPRDDVLRILATRHGEALIVRAMAGPRVFELYSNPDSRTWTVILTDNRGTACMAGSGTALEIVDSAAPKSGEKS